MSVLSSDEFLFRELRLNIFRKGSDGIRLTRAPEPGKRGLNGSSVLYAASGDVRRWSPEKAVIVDVVYRGR